jgi:prophage regulatory protein
MDCTGSIPSMERIKWHPCLGTHARSEVLKEKPMTSRGNATQRRIPQPLHAVQIANALLTMRTASVLSGLSKSTLYRMAKADPSFPTLVKIGTRCTRVRAGAFAAWLSSLEAQRKE